MGEYSVNNPLFGWIEGPWRFKKFHPSHSPLARASCLWAHAPISPLRLQVLRLPVRRSASPPGVSHCGLPPAGDLSGLQARHLRTQRCPGLPGPRPAAGKLRGSGLVGGEVPAGLGHQGTALWTKKEGVGPSLCREAPCPECLGGRMGAGEGRSPRGRSMEALGTDLGPEWPEGREQGGPDQRPQGEVWVNLSRER